jgi:hypothetical protein
MVLINLNMKLIRMDLRNWYQNYSSKPNSSHEVFLMRDMWLCKFENIEGEDRISRGTICFNLAVNGILNVALELIN